jgi:hypothetical protein
MTRYAGVALTFASVAFAMVFFRAPTISSALDLAKGMLAMNGVALPHALLDSPGFLANALHHIGVMPDAMSIGEFRSMMLWITVPLLIALAFPNTLQILARYEPALGVKSKLDIFSTKAVAEWNPSLPWAIGISAMAAVAMASIGGPSEFLYWQF